MECLLRYVFIFEVGDEIEINKIEKILNKAAQILEIKFEKFIPTHFKVGTNFLKTFIGKIKHGEFELDVSAKIFDMGNIIISIDLKRDIKNLDEITEIIKKVDFEKIARDINNRIRRSIIDSIINPKKDSEYEEYFMVFLKYEKDVEEFIKANKNKIASILELDEDISEKTVQDILKNSISYYKNEHIIVSWSGAFLINVDNIEEISYIFEIANLQQLVLRCYDYELDKVFKEVVKKIKVKWYNALFGNIYEKVRKIIEERIEIQETVESTMNLGKFFGDWYYAKVYELIYKELHIEEWRNNLFRKIDYIEEFYKSMDSRINSTRTLFIELGILIIFILDIFFYFFIVK
ncbi:MAG: hypothetical protein RMJ17_02055 [Candidatus Aenigmarchaeota archaeon]|nr:hypothetical protein [Candidatus Aenigmarchaeota archaeon]MDW8149357.1 hypothetical protein [Candidatus Aenigmarchaeota archaeon]